MPRRRPTTIVANSLRELETLNRLVASGEPDYPVEEPEPDDDPTDPDDEDTESPDDEDEPDGDPSEGDDAGVATQAPQMPDAAPAPALNLIKIVESWQYPGNLQDHPRFVDPSWAAYLTYDELTHAPGTPALRVPTPTGDKYARPGDYVVLQTTNPSAPTYVDVWAKFDFERFFRHAA